MQLVIDANVVISILIRPGKPLELLFRSEIEVFAPSLLFEEVLRNMPEITKKSTLSEDDLQILLNGLRTMIKVVPEEDFLHQRENAVKICPDPKDVTYFALALHLKCGIWSNEKKLKEQEKVPVLSTHELMKLF